MNRPPPNVPASFEDFQVLDYPLPVKPTNHFPHDRMHPNHSAPHRPTNSVLASLVPSRPSHTSAPSRPADAKSMSYAAYIKSATPGAFSSPAGPSKFKQPQPSGLNSNGNGNGLEGKTGEKVEEGGEMFDLSTAGITAEDANYLDRDSEKHMRELLSGAIGEGEDDGEEPMETVHGLAEGVTLMPHQQRGVRWLKKREAAKNFGGILADVSHQTTVMRLVADNVGYGSGEDCADDSTYMREESQCGRAEVWICRNTVRHLLGSTTSSHRARADRQCGRSSRRDGAMGWRDQDQDTKGSHQSDDPPWPIANQTLVP
jgi:hypothetical protein